MQVCGESGAARWQAAPACRSYQLWLEEVDPLLTSVFPTPPHPTGPSFPCHPFHCRQGAVVSLVEKAEEVPY